MGVSNSVEENKFIHSLVYENGKKELALIPLTTEYFPSVDSVGFKRFVECRKEERVQYMYCRSDSLHVTEASSKDDAEDWFKIFAQEVKEEGLLKSSNNDVREAVAADGPTACRPMWCAVSLVWDSLDAFENDPVRKAHFISVGSRWVEVVGYFGLRNSQKPMKEKAMTHELGMFWTKAAGDHLTNYVTLLAARCYIDQAKNILGQENTPYFPSCHLTTQENNVPVLKALQAFASSFDAALADGMSEAVVRKLTSPTVHFDLTLPPKVVQGGAELMANMIRPLCSADGEGTKSVALLTKLEVAEYNSCWKIHTIKDTEVKPTQFKSLVRSEENEDGTVNYTATFQGEKGSDTNSIIQKNLMFSKDFAELFDHVNDICVALGQCRALSPAQLVAKGQEITQNGAPTSLVLVSETAPSGRTFLFAVNVKKKNPSRNSISKRSDSSGRESSGRGTPIPIHRCDWIPHQNFEQGGFESHCNGPHTMQPIQPVIYVNNPYGTYQSYVPLQDMQSSTYLGGPPPPMGSTPPMYPRQ